MHQKIKSDQYLLFNCKQSPFSLSEFKKIEQLIRQLNYESVTAGDAGDQHKLEVGRFRRDINLPKDLSPACSDLMTTINSAKMQRFYQQLTGFNNVCIRRAQANILNPGDYVGIHIDGEGDPKYQGTHKDYKYAVILSFNSDYDGGETIIYPLNIKKQLKLSSYSMLIITGALPHEVKPVKAGSRKTIAYFLSDNFGPSQ